MRSSFAIHHFFPAFVISRLIIETRNKKPNAIFPHCFAVFIGLVSPYMISTQGNNQLQNF